MTTPNTGGLLLPLLLLTVHCLTHLSASLEPRIVNQNATADLHLSSPTLPQQKDRTKNHGGDRHAVAQPFPTATEPHPSIPHPPTAEPKVTPIPYITTITTTTPKEPGSARQPKDPQFTKTVDVPETTRSNATEPTSFPHRPLTPATAMFLMMGIVTLVGLLHFKVCTEFRRCWDAKGCTTDSRRAWRFFVLRKSKLALKGLLSVNKGNRDDSRSPSGQSLIPVSKMTGVSSKISVNNGEQSYV